MGRLEESLAIVGLQAEVSQGSIVASFTQLLGEEGASLQQDKVDEPPVGTLLQCVRITALAKVVKAAGPGLSGKDKHEGSA